MSSQFAGETPLAVSCKRPGGKTRVLGVQTRDSGGNDEAWQTGVEL